ncbi:MbtH family protein [Catellatospora sp. KI3]|uniref:MbtH family protein n=1 Tax=Catellatospora sp. KI3 TaxID=3041620 RepID=UPI002482714A|nr:MbtH family protein [Catellatospora sp. KI3]MDI1460722.1 MbtH family protein [Catellatospora sp. KI3]
MHEADEAQRYLVVVNDEEQYSVWPDGQPVPAGWTGDGFAGSREDCLEHIGQVWTDLRPRSVRLQAQGTR